MKEDLGSGSFLFLVETDKLEFIQFEYQTVLFQR